MSADVNLSSDDMRVECLLERFERERVANKSNDFVLNRIAGWALGRTVSGGCSSRWTDKKPRSPRFVEAGAESERHSHCGDLQSTQDSGHAQSHGPDTWIDVRITMFCSAIVCPYHRVVGF